MPPLPDIRIWSGTRNDIEGSEQQQDPLRIKLDGGNVKQGQLRGGEVIQWDCGYTWTRTKAVAKGDAGDADMVDHELNGKLHGSSCQVHESRLPELHSLAQFTKAAIDLSAE